MATRTRNTERREDALSRQRIVDAAVQVLDVAGESGLTFRALAARLRTGAGAPDVVGAPPAEAIRAVALGVFDAVETHPWVGTQLSRTPSQRAVLRVFERLGRQVQALGVAADDQFDAASALLNYVLGVTAQNAAQAREAAPGTNRVAFLESLSADLDPDLYPFTRTVAGQLCDHDDRAQFLAGIDLLLAGIAGLVQR